jgi:hypothetical protein
MARLCLFAVLVLVSACPGAVVAAESLAEKKPPTIQRNFDFPLDFKSRADFNIGDPSSIPPGVMPNFSVEAKRPFVGFGFTQPLTAGK